MARTQGKCTFVRHERASSRAQYSTVTGTSSTNQSCQCKIQCGSHASVLSVSRLPLPLPSLSNHILGLRPLAITAAAPPTSCCCHSSELASRGSIDIFTDSFDLVHSLQRPLGHRIRLASRPITPPSSWTVNSGASPPYTPLLPLLRSLLSFPTPLLFPNNADARSCKIFIFPGLRKENILAVTFNRTMFSPPAKQLLVPSQNNIHWELANEHLPIYKQVTRHTKEPFL
ncbi:hypothetical protein GQ55_2G300900 [Panicum hallii var. hallii]|uniref:Uncharacterized protein n=1 Tax=Panicum hallii var. hallii TaxID=1504633 RepID=A0A2T7ETV7_9POAL|nr:hypothetical protein GQ55_2G300900 [Panicum hallii var. hallii]